MICICDAKGSREAETARIAMAARLGVEASALAAALWRSLRDDFKATVTVGSDQWYGVWAKVDMGTDPLPCFTEGALDMECDHPLDGMIFIWNKLAETYPERAPANAARVDTALCVLSESQLREEAEAETARDAHWASCAPSCKEWNPLCGTGRALFTSRVDVCRAVLAKWGEPAPEDKKAFYGLDEGKDA